MAARIWPLVTVPALGSLSQCCPQPGTGRVVHVLQSDETISMEGPIIFPQPANISGKMPWAN
jgi:hypothetical protein